MDTCKYCGKTNNGGVHVADSDYILGGTCGECAHAIRMGLIELDESGDIVS